MRKRPPSSALGLPDPDHPVPAIEAVPDDPSRPFWSVMIPTYNCARFLPEALRSVLEQDCCPSAMQIEVIDDASTDDPEDVVDKLGGGRVTFFRQPVNRGAVANFNACLARSRGHLVHILHGDDLVAPGFYRAMAQLAERWPDTALLACRTLVIGETGLLLSVTPRILPCEQPGHDAGPLLFTNPFTFNAVVVRRRFYEAFGGFDLRLPHTADWEMWVRAFVEGGGVMTPEPLAYYRVFEGNDTSRLRRTGENLRDFLRYGEIVRQRVPRFDTRSFRAHVAAQAMEQARLFRSLGDAAAERANEGVWREAVTTGMILRRAARSVFDTLRDLRRKIAGGTS